MQESESVASRLRYLSCFVTLVLNCKHCLGRVWKIVEAVSKGSKIVHLEIVCRYSSFKSMYARAKKSEEVWRLVRQDFVELVTINYVGQVFA